MQKLGLNLYFAFTLLFLFSCSPSTHQEDKSDISYAASKIMNGLKVAPENFQEVVGVVSNDSIICSATAVRKKLLFTSAHCFIDFDEVRVEDGDSELFDELFENLGEDYCQSYQECLEELDHIGWKPSKRRFLDDHIDEVIRLTLEEITIHQGVGNPGGEVEGEDIVKEISFDPEWINLIKLRLYETFDVLSFGQSLYLKSLTEYDEYSFDYAQIHLKTKVKASHITPMLKQEKLEEGLPDGSKIVLIGFGHQLPTEGDEDENEDEVEDDATIDTYGEKMYTTLPISGLIENESGSFVIAAGEDEGACEGDSGGAAYVKLPNGKLKYIGIITAGADNCGDHIMWDTDSGSIQGNTIINVQLDPSRI